MRLVADNAEDYLKLTVLQKQITQLFKQEKGSDSALENVYKTFINTPIEKSYEKPGDSVKVANADAVMDTTDVALFIPNIVHAAINRLKVAIEYVDAKGKTSKRLIEPFNWRNNQLVAWCHERGAWRQFKPSQIRRVAVINQPFDRSEDVEIKASDAKEMAGLVNG